MKIEVLATGSKGNCYLVHNQNTKILLECGIDITTTGERLWNKYKIKISKLNACLISHCHQDHCNEITIRRLSGQMPVFGNQEVVNKFPKLTINKISNEEKFKIGDIRIKTFGVFHGDTQNNGFIFRDDENTMLFITDFAYTPYSLRNWNFDEIYIEINYVKEILEQNIEKIKQQSLEDYKGAKIDFFITKYYRQIKTHMALHNAINFLKSLNLSNTKKIVAIHMSLDCAKKEIIKEELQKNFNVPSFVALPEGGIE